VTQVDLADGEPPVQVEIEFLAPKEAKLKRNKPKLLPGFRVLQADGCDEAFHAPKLVEVSGRTVGGAKNKVRISVASLPDFLIMKSLALAARDKPKDAYDLCYCLDNYPGGMERLAKEWKRRARDKNVAKAVVNLREKFEAVDAYGPMQVVEFHNSTNPEERAAQGRRAYELVQKFLSML
jgi:predicted nucleotidyltransferase